MKCPHCQTAVHDAVVEQSLGGHDGGWMFAVHMCCPQCLKRIVFIKRTDLHRHPLGLDLVWPRQGSRPPAAASVPSEYADDYNEGCLVLGISPKASAALSRRCLQQLLREKEAVKPGNLSDEIKQVLEKRTLPSHIAGQLDTLRVIGNFAAHPMKDEKSGEVLDVEAGESEWTLDILESLFDFYFVMPATAEARKAAVNEKLRAAGKKEVP